MVFIIENQSASIRNSYKNSAKKLTQRGVREDSDGDNDDELKRKILDIHSKNYFTFESIRL